MRTRLSVAAIALVAALAIGVLAEGADAAAPKTYVGRVSVKPADAPANILGLLTVPAVAPATVDTIYKLTATGDVATQVTSLVNTGAEVVVKGTDASLVITVTSIQDSGAAKKDSGKKKQAKAKEGTSSGTSSGQR